MSTLSRCVLQASLFVSLAACGSKSDGEVIHIDTRDDVTFSTEERDWSVEQQALERSSWVFHEYADGDHGTKMFAADPSVIDDLDTFFVGVLGT